MTRSLSNPTTRIAVGVIALATIVAISSSSGDCFPWSIDMYRGPEIQPLAEAPRVTPADTIPVHGAGGPPQAPFRVLGGAPPRSLEQATLRMHNPMQPTAQNLAAGREQFDTYC